MFIILLISSALGACKDQDTQDKCLKESKCAWAVSVETPAGECYEPICSKIPMRGLCEKHAYCAWTDGECAIVDCQRYPPAKCEKSTCKKYPTDNPTACIPKSMVVDDKDTCSIITESNKCNGSMTCDWKSNKCVADTCYKLTPGADDCDEAKCKKVTILSAEFCVRKNYDADNRECFFYSAGAECDGSYDCMTNGEKCKKDECINYYAPLDETACKDKKDCTWGVPDLLKDLYKGSDKMCYHKDHVFESAALGVLPALIQNKVFQLASALLLFLLI